MQKDCLITYSTIFLVALHVSSARTRQTVKNVSRKILVLFVCSFNCSLESKLSENLL